MNRLFCSELAQNRAEPIWGTAASNVERKVLIELPLNQWGRNPLETLAPDVQSIIEAHQKAPRIASYQYICRADTTEGRCRAYIYPESRYYEGESILDTVLAVDRFLKYDCAGWGFANTPQIFVCCHGKRDACCAKHGTPLFRELSAIAGDVGVWQSNHIGGDRFAANALVFPHGLSFGRLRPDNGHATGLLQSIDDPTALVENLRGNIWLLDRHHAFADACARLFMRKNGFRARYRIFEMDPDESTGRLTSKIAFVGNGLAVVGAHLEYGVFTPDCSAIESGRQIRMKYWILDRMVSD